jgi:hypothetical protein
MSVDGAYSKKRPYFALEIYMKDNERWYRDLVLRDTKVLKADREAAPEAAK